MAFTIHRNLAEAILTKDPAGTPVRFATVYHDQIQQTGGVT